MSEEYPLTLIIDEDIYERQPMLNGEGWPGVPYARRADRGGARLLVRVELVKCVRCGRPLRQIIKAATPTGQKGEKLYVCGSRECNLSWSALVAGEPGKAPVLAMVLRKF